MDIEHLSSFAYRLTHAIYFVLAVGWVGSILAYLKFSKIIRSKFALDIFLTTFLLMILTGFGVPSVIHYVFFGNIETLDSRSFVVSAMAYGLLSGLMLLITSERKLDKEDINWFEVLIAHFSIYAAIFMGGHLWLK